MKKTVKISGMMCEHCKKSVFNALAEICGEENVFVDLEKGIAQVEFSGDDSAIKDAVEDIGFSVEEILG